MKKEVEVTKKPKNATQLQKKAVVTKVIEEEKVAKVTKPKLKPHDPTISELVHNPLVLIPVVFFGLFAALALWMYIIPMDKMSPEPTPVETDDSFKFKDATFEEKGTTTSGIPYSISIKYPQIISTHDEATSLSGEMLYDITKAAQTYVSKITTTGDANYNNYSLIGTYTVVSSKNMSFGDVVSITLTSHEMVKSKISTNREDSSDVITKKTYVFDITNNVGLLDSTEPILDIPLPLAPEQVPVPDVILEQSDNTQNNVSVQ